jgi:nitroreductase/Pyruvate/2-oxoacid:ferredoxin oxidoreductase delta subunit
MEFIRGIDKELCNKCGKCIIDCPLALFLTGEKSKSIFFSDPYDRCIACGHCIAICPRDAILFTHEEKPLEHGLISTPDKILGTEKLMVLLRARRSIRHFKDRIVPEHSLKKILQAMRYAPTASNRERIYYTVVKSKEKIQFLSDRVIGLFKLIRLLLSVLRFFIPFGRKTKGGVLSNGLFFSLKNALRQVKEGRDPIFFHAPCLIIVSSPLYQHQAGVDAGIALAHGMIVAQAEGLGTCLIGFAHETMLRSRFLRRYFKLPAGYKPQGVMVIGFSKVKYQRAPMRKPLSVTLM